MHQEDFFFKKKKKIKIPKSRWKAVRNAKATQVSRSPFSEKADGMIVCIYFVPST